MFAGEKINTTENRAVLHTALRVPVDREFSANGQDIAADVHEVLGRMRDFAKALRSGAWLGVTDHTIKNVVNIGIGGSDLALLWLHARYARIRQRELRRISSPISTQPT